jgi:hypothetical protein
MTKGAIKPVINKADNVIVAISTVCMSVDFIYELILK